MKKIVFSVLLFCVLLVGTFSFVIPAEAAAVPKPENLRWDILDNYGTAMWDSAGTDATYTLRLYKQTVDASTPEKVGSDISCGKLTQQNLMDGIRSKGAGKYTFTVQAKIGDATSGFTAIDFDKLSLDFTILDPPHSPIWDWNTNDVVRASWTGVPDSENYYVRLWKSSSADGSSPIQVSSGYVYTGANTSCSVFDIIKQAKSGYYAFDVRAVSSRAGDSEWSDKSEFFKYPIKLDTPKNARWSHLDDTNEYGMARWDIVPNATGYLVQFYQVLPYRVDIIGADGKPSKDPVTGQTLQETKYYYYKTLGNPITLKGSLTEPPSNYCRVDNLINGSGIFMFTVQATGDQSFENSEITKLFVDGFTPTNTDGNLVLGQTKEASKANILSNVYFDYIAPTKISIDLDNNGFADEDQSKTLFVALGQKKTIGVIVEPADATPTGFIWSNSLNSAAFDYFTANGKTLTMSTCNKGKLTISVKPVLSNLTKNISITSSEPPVKLIISGKNSYTTNDTGDLYLQVIPETAYATPEYIEWTSSNPNVATVNGGKVTTAGALSSGKSIDYATITAKSKLDDRIQGTYRIAVSNTQILPSRIVISGNNTVALKSKLQLTANVYAGQEGNENEGFAYNKEVTWTTSNDKVATVDAKGLITPKAVGKVIITATSKADGSSNVKGSIEINVVPEEINITKISLSGPTTVKVGETINIKAAITPTNATDRTLVWSCSGYGQLDYTDELTRKFTGIYEGESVITVYAQNAPSIKATLKIKVTTASDKPDTDKGETQVITNVKPTPGTGDKKNEYTAVVKPEVLNEAIDKAFSEAYRLKTTPVVTIKVDTPSAAVDLIVKLPYSSIGKFVSYYSYDSYDRGILEIETGIATMRIPKAALRQIYNQSNYNTDIQTKFTRVVNSELNEWQKAAIGKRSVIDLTISSAGKDISSFGNNPITVGVPFTLTSTQSGKGAQVDNLTYYGQLDPMSCNYNYKTKRVNFDTYHLSLYSPYYYAAIAWDNPFIDVRSTDWYYDSVFYVVDRQLMRGVSAERFVPASYTTRGMVVTILHRLAGSPAPTAKNTFTDVKSGQWYTDAVLWATENKLVSGYGGGKFGPDDKVTREQLGVMLHNYAKYVDITPKYGWDTPMRYPDSNKVSNWARQGAMYCQITGIISGRPNGNFEPKDTATRAELATMLLRMNDQMQKQLEAGT